MLIFIPFDRLLGFFVGFCVGMLYLVLLEKQAAEQFAGKSKTVVFRCRSWFLRLEFFVRSFVVILASVLVVFLFRKIVVLLFILGLFWFYIVAIANEIVRMAKKKKDI